MILEQLKVNNTLLTFGSNCFDEALQATPPKGYSSVFVISQQNIWDLHGARLEKALAEVEPVHMRMVPDGEETKNLGMYGELLSWLAHKGADRRSLIIVLGGGVVGDLSGFVAASYMRGMQWIYIPTTLLAQQDASIGGKVAVNLPEGKNLVGQFWDPKAVIIDSLVLGTLPMRQINAGYMEFLKHGMLKSDDLYQRILQMPEQPDWTREMGLLAEGLKVKVEVVQEDPFEKNIRRLLNLGHTFGHALESYTEYRQFLHGEAVGLGLIFAGLLSRRLGGDYDWGAMTRVVRDRVPDFDPSTWDGQRILDLTLLDKKGVKGIVSWIIPFKPGKVEIVKGVERAILNDALEEFISLMR